jgi:hypothetical protein
VADDERKYTDEQMALILRRAGDLQAQRDDGRHSLTEIQEIARQVGIDPALVAHVAAGLPRKAAILPAASSTLVQTTETVLPQRVTPEQMGRLVDAVRRASGAQGTSRQVFDSVEWRWGSEHELVDLRVTITPAADRTNVRVQHDATGAAFLSMFVPAFLSVIGIAASFSALPGAAGAAASAGIVGAIGGVVWAIRRRLRRSGAELLERVSQAVGDEAGQGSGDRLLR